MEGEEWVRAGAQRRNEECVGGGDSWKKCCGLEGGLQGGQDGGASEGHTSTANSSAAWKEDSNENDRRRPRVTDVMVPRRYKAITMPPILRMRVTILGISVDNRSIMTITPGIRTVAAIVLRHRPAMINKSTCNVENTNSENSNLSMHANTCFEARAGGGGEWDGNFFGSQRRVQVKATVAQRICGLAGVVPQLTGGGRVRWLHLRL